MTLVWWFVIIIYTIILQQQWLKIKGNGDKTDDNAKGRDKYREEEEEEEEQQTTTIFDEWHYNKFHPNVWTVFTT